MSVTEEVRDLLYQIRLGEDSKYEFKAVTVSGNRVTDPHKDSLADELAAFANAQGGLLILGVDDKTREVTGIPRDQLDLVESWTVNISQTNIDPPLAIQTHLLEVPDREGNFNAVIQIEIQRSLFVHRSSNGYFHRVGSSKRQMSPDMLARLFQQRSQSRLIRFDEQPVPNTSFDDLEPLLSKRFIADSGQPAELQLRKLRLLSHEDDHDQLTVAGVLLGTPEPRQWLPNAYVQAVFYRGTDRDAENQLDAEDISGPLDSQINQALDFVNRNMRIEAVKRPGRIEIPQYSIRAVFEAIVNAVAHRDYSIYGSKIRLHMFADRLQINSPGALANSMEVDALALRQSTRNELIASLLARCPFNDADVNRSFIMDKRGEGVPVILRESELLSKRRPEYQLIGGEELQLTIYAASREQNGIVEQFE